MTQDSNDLKDIRKLISDLPKPEPVLVTEDKDKNLGVFQNEITWLRLATGKAYPEISMPRIAIFAAHHGFALKGPQGKALKESQEITIDRILGNTHSTCNLAQSLNTDLRLYEMDLENPARDTAEGPAMDEEECTMALTYGMMAVEEHNDFLILSTLGAGSEEAGKKIIDMMGKDKEIDAFDLLMQIGGYEIAALCGVIIATFLGKKPVFIDSYAGLAAALLMNRANPLLTTQIAFISDETYDVLTCFKDVGDLDDLCARAGFKLAQLKVLLGLITPPTIDSLNQKQAKQAKK